MQKVTKKIEGKHRKEIFSLEKTKLFIKLIENAVLQSILNNCIVMI